jgi:hypothetical protein
MKAWPGSAGRRTAENLMAEIVEMDKKEDCRA